MLASALIVFREVIEAALIVTIIMAATRQVRGRGAWVCAGIGLGVAGSFLVALMAGGIAEAFDGAGQELVNAAILGLAVCLISWHVVWMNSHGRQLAAEMKAVGREVAQGSKHMRILAVVIGLAVMREGSEVVLMLQGLSAGTAESVLMLYGGAGLGLLAGIAFSACMYFGFLALPIGRVFSMTNGFLVLIAAGMAARAVNFLTQAGLLSISGTPLWDTSTVISEQSLVGQVLAALTGYIANPNSLQLVAYMATILTVLCLMQYARRVNNAA